MSYDVTLTWRGYVSEWFNYTYNCYPMFRDALGGDGINDLHGKKGSELLPRLNDAIAKMEADPAKYRAMEPSNGWGDYEGALKFLIEIKHVCATHPDCEVNVS